MKENLKIKVNDFDRQEVIDLLGKLGKSFSWDVKTRWSEIAAIFAYKKQNLEWDNDLGFNYFKGHSNKEITLTELREIAREKEYLNDKFELIVTNQPDDGWRLVPDGVNTLTKFGSSLVFWCDGVYVKSANNNKVFDMAYNTISAYMGDGDDVKILWQRENKVETVKGRFLHQWAYEAFGRGEDVQHTPCLRDCPWTTVTMDKTIGIFNNPHNKFRLKPQTIIIGSRTINKPISVKPELGQEFYVSSIASIGMALSDNWKNSDSQNEVFNRNLCHLTKEDAINHTDALLELMATNK